jgi:hypothetical protein
LTAIAAAMAGGVIAFYQLGYGIAAFGVGPGLDGGVKLLSVYAAAAVIAAGMGVLSFVVARPQTQRVSRSRRTSDARSAVELRAQANRPEREAK